MSQSTIHPPILKGTCACTSTTWTATTAPTTLDYCYCTQCQRTTGSPFGAWLSIAKPTLIFTGPLQTCTISTIATRSHCGTCGSSLTIQYHCYPDKTHVAAGSVVEGVDMVPQVGCHLFVGRKPGWYEIPDDGVGRWREFPEDFLVVFEKWKAEGARISE